MCKAFTAVLRKVVTLLRLLQPKDEGATMLRNVGNYYAKSQRQIPGYCSLVQSLYSANDIHVCWWRDLYQVPILVAALSKAWVCYRSLAGVAGSNSAGSHGCLSVVSVVCF